MYIQMYHTTSIFTKNIHLVRYTCNTHVIHMGYTWDTHVIHMGYTCNTHVIHMQNTHTGLLSFGVYTCNVLFHLADTCSVLLSLLHV